nr:Ycf15 [Barnadesia lehmannii]QKY75413.1 Ycf15 [Barnadesia lehmannii]
MRVQLHCIARIHVVYLKEVDLLASLTVQSSSRRAPFLLGPQRQNVGLASSSRKKGLTKPGSLTKTNLI